LNFLIFFFLLFFFLLLFLQDSIPLGFIFLELCTVTPIVDEKIDSSLHVDYGFCFEFDSMSRAYVLVAKVRKKKRKRKRKRIDFEMNSLSSSFPHVHRTEMT